MFDETIRNEQIKTHPSIIPMLPKVEKVMRYHHLNDDTLSITFENAGEWKLYFAILLYTCLRITFFVLPFNYILLIISRIVEGLHRILVIG